MITHAAVAAKIWTIANEIGRLCADADEDHPLDPHEVRVAMHKLGCQCELLEKELVE